MPKSRKRVKKRKPAKHCRSGVISKAQKKKDALLLAYERYNKKRLLKEVDKFSKRCLQNQNLFEYLNTRLLTLKQIDILMKTVLPFRMKVKTTEMKIGDYDLLQVIDNCINV